MLLKTDIPARRDGSLTVTMTDGRTLAFERDEDGELAREVSHDDALELLSTGNFFPADPDDETLVIGAAMTGGETETETETEQDAAGAGAGAGAEVVKPKAGKRR